MQCSTVESRVRFVCMHPSTVPRLLLYMSTLTKRIHFKTMPLAVICM
jgi:hypothetical protein